MATSEPELQHAYLEIEVQNGTSVDLEDAEVFFGKHACTLGVVGARVSKGVLGWQQPVATNAVVRWRDSANTSRESRVDLAKVYTPSTPGILTFTISGTNVTVAFEKINR
jgi:hypothetical protein